MTSPITVTGITHSEHNPENGITTFYFEDEETQEVSNMPPEELKRLSAYFAHEMLVGMKELNKERKRSKELTLTVLELEREVNRLRTQLEQTRGTATQEILDLILQLEQARETATQEIVDLILQLDDFCVGQFKKRLDMYVDEALSLPECPEFERKDWVAGLHYNIKTDLENYIKQLPKSAKKGE